MTMSRTMRLYRVEKVLCLKQKTYCNFRGTSLLTITRVPSVGPYMHSACRELSTTTREDEG